MVHALDAVDDLVGHVMQVAAAPCLVDFVQKSLRHEVFHLGDALVRGGMSAHAQLCGRELVERHVRGFLVIMFHDEGRSDVRFLVE